MIELKNKKVTNFAFIDSQNVNLAIKDQGWVLDWLRFRKYLSDKYNVSRAYLFIGFVEGNNDLYSSLQQNGYILIFKPTMELPDGKVKGNVDAELVLYSMIEYSNYDKAVIVTGDGDFYCLVKYLRERGKLAVLLVPNFFKYSGLLKKSAGKLINFMNQLNNKLAYKKRTPEG